MLQAKHGPLSNKGTAVQNQLAQCTDVLASHTWVFRLLGCVSTLVVFAAFTFANDTNMFGFCHTSFVLQSNAELFRISPRNGTGADGIAEARYKLIVERMHHRA